MYRRLPFFLGFLVCAGLIGMALHMQYRLEMEPCNLCIFQRMCIIGLGAVLLLATLHGPRQVGRRVYGLLGTIISLTGMGLAGRQLWLQSRPDTGQPADCGAPLEFMFESLPLQDVIQLVLKGSGDCSEVHPFMGLSISMWMMIVFVSFLIASLYFLFKRVRARHFEHISGLNR